MCKVDSCPRSAYGGVSIRKFSFHFIYRFTHCLQNCQDILSPDTDSHCRTGISGKWINRFRQGKTGLPPAFSFIPSQYDIIACCGHASQAWKSSLLFFLFVSRTLHLPRGNTYSWCLLSSPSCDQWPPFRPGPDEQARVHASSAGCMPTQRDGTNAQCNTCKFFFIPPPLGLPETIQQIQRIRLRGKKGILFKNLSALFVFASVMWKETLRKHYLLFQMGFTILCISITHQ